MLRKKILILLITIVYLPTLLYPKPAKPLTNQVRGVIKPSTHRPIAKPLNPPEDLEDFLPLDAMDYPTEEILKCLILSFWPQLKDIVIKKEHGGSYTGAIFSVSHMVSESLKKVFFLKISNKDAHNTWKNLQRVQDSKIGQFAGYKNPHAPIVTTVEKFFMYRDSSNNVQTIEVTHAAKGEVVANMLLNNATQSEKNECALATGKALGLFHQAFMTYENDILPETWRTITHGDFHPGNVFFHKASHFSRIYFIDNETMALSLDSPRSIREDIFKFYFSPTEKIDCYGRASDMQWQEIVRFCHHFIKGYVESYPKKRRESVICYLHEIINTELNTLFIPISEQDKPENQSWMISQRRLEMLLIEHKNLSWYILPSIKIQQLKEHKKRAPFKAPSNVSNVS